MISKFPCFMGLLIYAINLVLTNHKQIFMKSELYLTSTSSIHKMALKKTFANS